MQMGDENGEIISLEALRGAIQFNDTLIPIVATILGLSVLFLTGASDYDDAWRLQTSWLLFGLSLSVGIVLKLVFSIIRLNLSNARKPATTFVLYVYLMIPVVLFLVGLSFFIAFGWNNISGDSTLIIGTTT